MVEDQWRTSVATTEPHHIAQQPHSASTVLHSRHGAHAAILHVPVSFYRAINEFFFSVSLRLACLKHITSSLATIYWIRSACATLRAASHPRRPHSSATAGIRTQRQLGLMAAEALSVLPDIEDVSKRFH